MSGFPGVEGQIPRQITAELPHGAAFVSKFEGLGWPSFLGWTGLSLRGSNCYQTFDDLAQSESPRGNLLVSAAPAPTPRPAASGRASVDPATASSEYLP